MLSARMKTPPAVKSPFINKLQARYARLLRWTLEHRGWSALGIVLIAALSAIPINMSKGDEGGDDDPGEIAIFYQW